MTEAWLEVLTFDACVSLLHAQRVGRLSFQVDGLPTIVPINYRLVGEAPQLLLAVRTRAGSGIERAEMMVAFEIDGIDLGREQGWSVLVRGTLHHIDADVPGMRELFDSEPWLAERDTWLVIDPYLITGRRLHAPEPEAAFHLHAYL
jgi:nitroimidazol reductase NimA-like FMN-containing flavoprotein (pyridoxamine 5'-phosphate oxidase superfamily)